MKLNGGMLPCTRSSSNIDTVWVNWTTYLRENKWSIHLVNQKKSYSSLGFLWHQKDMPYLMLLYSQWKMHLFLSVNTLLIMRLKWIKWWNASMYMFVFQYRYCVSKLNGHTFVKTNEVFALLTKKRVTLLMERKWLCEMCCVIEHLYLHSDFVVFTAFDSCWLGYFQDLYLQLLVLNWLFRFWIFK